MRKIYILLTVLILGMIGMCYLYFSNLNTETNTNDLSLKVAAANSAIIFSFENDKGFYEILNGQSLIQELIGESNTKLFTAIKKNLIDNNQLSDLLNNQQVYIGIANGEKNETDFIISTRSISDASKILSNLNINKTKIYTLENTYQLTFADSSTCYVAIKDQLIVMSNALKQLEKILLQKTAENAFSDFIKTNFRFSKNTLANLYIDFNKLPEVLKGVLNGKLNGELTVFNQLDAYAALSYNFSSERLLFNGNTTVNTKHNYYKIFSNSTEQKITITNILPEKTANFTAFVIADYNKWYNDFKELLVERKEDKALEKSLNQINERYRIDLSSTLPSYFNNQLLTFQLNTSENLGAIALTNGDKVNQLLLDLSTEYAPDIRLFKEANIAYTFFGDPFKKFERPYFTIINSFLIMANNASTIQSFLNSYNTDKLLVNDVDYQNYSNQLSASATILYYINAKNSSYIFSKHLKKEFFDKTLSKSEIGGFTSFSYQLIADKNKFLSNILFYKTPKKEIITDTLSAIQKN